MTNREFEILDELYFVISFKELQNSFSWSREELKQELFRMVEKGWVKCIDPFTELELEKAVEDFDSVIDNTLFLATKKGLMEHNSREA